MHRQNEHSSDARMNGPKMHAPQEKHGMGDLGLLDIWGICMRRRWLLVFGLAVGLGLACLYQFKTEPVYESEVEVLVVQKELGTAQDAGVVRDGVQKDLLAKCDALPELQRRLQTATAKLGTILSQMDAQAPSGIR